MFYVGSSIPELPTILLSSNRRTVAMWIVQVVGEGIGSARRARLAIPFACAGILFMFLLAPLIFRMPAPVGGDILDSNLPMLSRGHLLGTDMNGNDIASRLMHGGRTSLMIAFMTNALGLILGGAVGAGSALRGGVVDGLVMRVIDSFLALPALMLILAIAQAVESTPINLALVLAVFSIPAFARLARATTLSVMAEAYMTAATLSGTGFFRKLVLHVAPVIVPQLLTFGVLGVGTVITIEGALSFLGFGIKLPNPSWGGMIYQGQQVLSASPRLVLLPSLSLFITVLIFNVIGQRLRSVWESGNAPR
jgi:peptide/nickel transport system permease protein